MYSKIIPIHIEYWTGKFSSMHALIIDDHCKTGNEYSERVQMHVKKIVAQLHTRVPEIFL